MSHIYSPSGQPVGHFNPYNNSISVDRPVYNPHNPYLSVGPGTYFTNNMGSVYKSNPMTPIGTLGPNNTLFPG